MASNRHSSHRKTKSRVRQNRSQNRNIKTRPVPAGVHLIDGAVFDFNDVEAFLPLISANWTPRKTSPFGEEFDSVGALICGE